MTFSDHRNFLKSELMIGVAIAAMSVGSAFAQSVPAEQSAQAGTNDPNDIIVTAQRRAERLEDVPVSITALTTASIRSAGIERIDQLQQVASGTQINKGGSFTQPSIRGISTLTLGYGFENNVAFYIDGFYQADMVTINQDLGTVQSLQVLKGPQGTLYGRNATGGAIVVETLAPSDEFKVNGRFSYGRFDDKRAQAYISGPIADGIKFSVAGYHRESDGYIKDLNTGADVDPLENTSVRSKLQLEPTSNLTVTLAYNYGFVRDDRGVTYVINAYPNYAASTVPLTCPNTRPGCVGQPARRATERDTASVNGVNSSAATNEFTGKVQFKTAIGTLTSYTGYTKRHSHSVFDFDGSLAQVTFARNDQIFDKTFQQTFDYAIDVIDNLDVIVGGFFYNDQLRIGPSISYSGGDTDANIIKRNFVKLDTDAMAFYVDATLHLGDSLFLTGGARYSAEHRRLRYRDELGAFGTLIGQRAFPAGDRSADFEAVTPRAVIRYELSPRTNVYVSYSQGFRSGVFNPVPAARPELAIPVSPEKIKAYEIGFKTAGSIFRFDTAAWYYDFRNLQVGVTIPFQGSVIQTIGNAKKAESYGAEAQFQLTPVEGLNLRAGGAWIHARYKDFKNAIGTGLNATTMTNASGQTQDWSGQQMARAPSFSGNVGFDFTTDVADGKLNLAGNASFTSSYVVANPSLYGPLAGAFPANKQRYREGGYALVNAQINWTDPGEHYTIGVYGENITNTRYNIVKSGGAFGDYSQGNEPATYGVRVGINF